MNLFKFTIFAGIAATALSSCVKDTLYEAKGNIEVTTVWNNISADAAMPAEYTMQLQWTTPDARVEGGNRTVTASGDKYTFNGIAIGEYSLSVYNTPEGVTIDGNRASIDKIYGGNGGIIAAPGTMFSGDYHDYTSTIHVAPASTYYATVNMVQLMRSVDLVLNIVEGDYSRIASAMATIDGVYGAIDFVTHSADQADRTRTTAERLRQSEALLTAQFRLFAIPEADYSNMSLKVDILFDNGETRTITSDISGVTKDFGKSVSPLAISADMHLPVKGGFVGSIDGWKVADGGGYDAH